MANDLMIPGKVTVTSLTLAKTISDEEWVEVGNTLGKIEKSSMWWIGDWLKHKYPDGYVDRGVYGELEDKTGIERGTMQVALSVCKSVDSLVRTKDLSFPHHKLVASLLEPQQKKWLDRALKGDNGEKWTVRQLREAIRLDSFHPPIIPEGTFDIILADPPWAYRNSGFEMSAEKKFPTMETPDICAYRDATGKLIQDSIAENSVCFMWATNPLLPDALDVLKAWGFDYKTNMVWVKDSHTAGFYVYGMHELLLIGVKGSNMLPDEKGKPKSVLYGKSSRHSEKPVEAYETIEAMYPGRSYLEVFARTNRKGWASVGNEN